MPYKDINSEAAKASRTACNKRFYAKNQEEQQERTRVWRQENPDKVKAQKQRHTQKYLAKSVGRILEWKKEHPALVLKSGVAYHRREKEKFIAAYGGSCQCCGEDRYEFLTLDHINGRGKEHRNQSGRRLYACARREGYPKDKYRLLCMSCNFSFGCYGYCPHQNEDGLRLVSAC